MTRRIRALSVVVILSLMMLLSACELGFQYNITSDTLTFYKTAYSEEPWYCFKRQG